MPIPLLVVIELEPESLARLEAGGVTPYVALTPDAQNRAVREAGGAIRAVLTKGTVGFSAADMDRMPRIEIICAQGAGYEEVDVAAARARGIAVTYGPGTNESCVADHAMAMLFSIVRRLSEADAAVRRGEWDSARDARPELSGKKLGILGLGNIGAQIARRGAAGFGMQAGYHNRKPKQGSPYLFFPSARELAAWANFLVIAAPGGPATRHLIDAGALQALGPQGFLVNIARGSVVDTTALIEALREKTIAGAALDVVEGEPHVPPALLQLDNVLLSPHLAGRSPEALSATMDLVIENLRAHEAGQPLRTPVP